ncbi:MAG TPA: TIGR03032 family protein [Rubricoccaceae bacterium]|jgi:uncharacterized protein (TIGR03032 family)
MPDPTTFACTTTPGFADLLEQLGCSLVLSTYQAGKLVVLSSEGGQLVQLPRTFDKPMGMAVDGRGGVDRLAVATREAVVVLGSAPELAAGYPGAPGRYDGLFVPTATYQTGELDLHDMAWGVTPEGHPGLWAVNTRFSCLGLVGDGHHFRPAWTPPWVSALGDEDRCHLNGMALRDGRPAYVTALGQTDTPRGWSPGKLTGGVLFDVTAGEEAFTGLPMPHSPRLFDGALYVLFSARGEVVRVDPEAGEVTTVLKVPSFLRGMARYGDVVFVGMSKLRKGRSLGDLPMASDALRSGVLAFHLPTGQILGEVSYHADVEEIYDVVVLPGMRRPGLLGPESPQRKAALAMPGLGFWASPREEEPAPAATGATA